MRTKTNFILCFLFLAFSSFSIQDKLTIIGEFDGAEDYGYNFIFINSEGEEKMITFQEIEEKVLLEFDLDSDSLIGKKFEITYTSELEVEIDEDGYEDEVEILTIIGLKKLK